MSQACTVADQSESWCDVAEFDLTLGDSDALSASDGEEPRTIVSVWQVDNHGVAPTHSA